MKIFICGNSRSGTTMMSRIMGNHTEVFAFQELHFFDELINTDNPQSVITPEKATKLFATLFSIQRNGYFGSRVLSNLDLKEAEGIKASGTISPMSVYEQFLVRKSSENNKSIPCEQTPQNIYALNDILNYFPDARIIIMIRDPREVLLSQKNKWKRRKLSGGQIPLREAIRSRINYHPITISKIWNVVIRTALSYSSDARVLLVKYEDLVREPGTIVKNICTHCQIPFQEKMLDIPVVGSSNFTDQSSQIGIVDTKTRQWELGGINDTEIYISQSINQKYMTTFGYVPKHVSPSRLLLLWYNISLPFRLGIAICFNLKRLKNIKKMAGMFVRN